jgi:predicted site-specific integrase-resolvase
MNLAAWAERNGVARVTAYRWFHSGRLAVSAQRVGRLILVNDAAAETAQHRRTAVYARVSSADQKADLDRQVARVTAWATTERIPVDKVVTEVGSATQRTSPLVPCFAARPVGGPDRGGAPGSVLSLRI